MVALNCLPGKTNIWFPPEGDHGNVCATVNTGTNLQVSTLQCLCVWQLSLNIYAVTVTTELSVHRRLREPKQLTTHLYNSIR